MSPWTCPACGRTFGRRNQPHGCTPVVPVDGWLDGLDAAHAPVARAFVAAVRDLGPVTIDTVGTGLMVKKVRTFAEIARRRTGWRMSVLLSHELDDPRVVKTLQLSAHRWAASVDLVVPDDLDETLRARLVEAYEGSPSA